jgi:hypothetical protein
MGSQFTPFYRAHDPTAQRLDKLTDEISGLREDIKGSHERMERSFDRLVAIMSQDRWSRSTTSRSSRGCSPALSYSDSNNCPNVLYFLIVHSVASHSDQTEPKCWCM